jgi:hypothetical protein
MDAGGVGAGTLARVHEYGPAGDPDPALYIISYA